MKIIVAKSAGFCYGVSRAVAMCERAAEEYGNCVTLGPIIHNEHVISDLLARGVRTENDISGISSGDTVIIRSHGAGKDEYDALSVTCAKIIDATCPDVKKIHDIVSSESQEGRLILVIGQRNHPEITAITGWCDDFIVFETLNELIGWLSIEDNKSIPVSVVFQTTNTRYQYSACLDAIKKLCTNQRIFDTICHATCRRQQEAVEISKTADAVIVVGDNNSANSVKLADVCSRYCARVLFVQSADDIDPEMFQSTDVVGITAGASTPAFIIKEVTRKMSKEVNMDGTLAEQEETAAVSANALPEPESDIPQGETLEPEVNPPETDKPLEAAVEPETTEQPESTFQPESTEMQTEPSNEPEVISQPEEAAQPEKTAEPEEADLPEETAEPEVTTQPEAVAQHKVEAVTNEESQAEDGDFDDLSDDQAEASESFAEMLEKSIKTLRTGEKVSGIVTSITSTEVSLDLGTKQSGYIPITEFINDETTDIDDVIKIGDTIESFVMRVNDVEGMVMLSKKRLDAIKNWDIVESAKDNKTIVEGYVVEDNKGGIVVNVKGVRVFVPASQTGLPKSAPMTELLKKQVKLRIIEVNQSRRRVVGSIRLVANDERRERSDKVWTDIEVGKTYDGVVKSMTNYGVFVDIGGVDGMIHISELSWTRIKQPSEIMAVGDEVSVYVLSFDKESRKISLGFKKGEDNPWTKFTSRYSVGEVVNVRIVKMMPFGAFAEICPGVDGLIHISQITDHRIGLPSEVLSDGQSVDVKITEIDNDRKKVSLSIRALIEPSSQPISKSDEEKAEEDDRIPVVVYDTDAPPPMDDEEDESDIQTSDPPVDEPALPEVTEEPEIPEKTEDSPEE